MKRAEVIVSNQLGLHARASARFVQVASRYGAVVRVSAGTRVVDGKSILGLLMLAAARGTTIVIEAEGSDAEAALAALVALVERGFEGGT